MDREVGESLIVAEGAPIRVVRQGAGSPTFVLLHGWGSSADVMRPIADHLAESRQTLAIDFPGFGKSPPPPSAWGVPDYAAATIALLEQLGVVRPVLLGHSFGARVAICMTGALKYDAHRLILVGAAGIRQREASNFKTALFKGGKLPLYLLPKRMRDALLDRLKERFGSADYRAARGVMREVLVQTVNLDLSDLLPHIRQETLLIWGDRDTQTPLWQGREMERLLPHAGLALIEDAGHYSFLDRPAVFYAILDSYLRTL